MSTSSRPPALAAWHAVVESRDPARLPDLFAPEAVFHSPILFTPQKGRDLVVLYLTGALRVLGNESFHYVREVVGAHDAVLEFVTDVDGITVNGVDMIRWDDEDRIVDFTVMLRPLKAVNLVHSRMAELLAAAGG